MIELTRLNAHPLYLNPDLLKLAEAAPDTVLTLITGDKLVVRETCVEVAAIILRFRAQVLAAAWPGAAPALNAASAAVNLSPHE